MVLTLYSYRVKPPYIAAVNSLYLEWQNCLRSTNLISLELFAGIHDPEEMMLVARYRDEEAFWTAVDSSQHLAWYTQLARITEEGPAVSYYREVRCEDIQFHS
jgi:quinol monooxygenase YgiN